jgi:hypothetical protein
MKARLAVILLLVTLATGRADDASPPAPAAAPVTDPARVAAHFREVVSGPGFQEPAEPPVDDRLRRWLSECFARFGSKFEQFRYAQEMPRFASLLTTVLVGAALVGLLYVLLRLTRQRSRRDSSGPGDSSAPAVFRPPEFYEEELHRAAAAGDWRAAWLASWRQFLSRLEKGRLVAADRSRTNREYLAQLRGQPQTGPALVLVAGMVDAYDRFIYGRRAIAEPDWRSFQGQVDEAALLLHLIERPASSPARAP